MKIVFCVLIVLCLGTFGAVAQSQQQRNITTNDQQRAATDDRGTASHPLTVNVVPAPTPREQAKRDQEDRAERLDMDWWAKVFGLSAIGIGTVQAIIFAGQLVIFGELSG